MQHQRVLICVHSNVGFDCTCRVHHTRMRVRITYRCVGTDIFRLKLRQKSGVGYAVHRLKLRRTVWRNLHRPYSIGIVVGMQQQCPPSVWRNETVSSSFLILCFPDIEGIQDYSSGVLFMI